MNETLLHVLGIVDLDDNRAIFRLEEQRDRGLIEVSVVGENLVINDKQKAGEPITLGAGDHKLRVTRGELEFESDNFTLKRGDRIVLNVKLAEGQVQVVRDQSIIGKRDMPAASRLGRDPGYGTPSGDRNRDAAMAQIYPERRAAEWVLSVGGTIGIHVGDEHRSIQKTEELPAEPYSVRSVYLDDLEVRESDLVRLLPLRQLGLLHVGPVTDEGLAIISDMQSLTIFRVAHSPTVARLPMTAEGLQHLACLPNLGGLRLAPSQLKDADFKLLKEFPKLGVLQLDGGTWSDATLEALRNVELETLIMESGSFSETGLANLGQMQQLNGLNLADCNVIDSGMAHVGKLTGLRHLYLADSTITDRGIAQILDLPELSALSLLACPVTDAALERLSQLKSLTQLYLRSTKVTAGGVARFKLARPDCTITSDFTDEQIAAELDKLK
jgi:hypothetical protein